ncbi:MAG: histidine phosphatase family protein [Actinomycetota bacterium]|nr:histidine phosphatase family protein [Actinomycetota bacterium]
MRVFLVRHAEAAPGEPDELRPLTPAGRSAARELGERLARDRIEPAVVLTSPLLRARETGQAIAAEVGCPTEPTDKLAFGASADDLRRAVAGRGQIVVAVGHQPDCGRIAAEISGGPEPAFPPAGMVELRLDN